MNSDLTALVLAHNKKENIARTLAAAPPLQEVVLIDTSSTDETVEIAKTAAFASATVFVLPAHSGLVVSPKPNAIATAVLRLLSDTSLAQQLAQNGAIFALRTFAPDAIGMQFAKAYRSILGKPRCSACQR